MKALFSLILGGAWKWIAVAVGALFTAYRTGGNRAKSKARETDTRRAREIEETADETLRRNDGDSRDVDDQLREHNALRD